MTDADAPEPHVETAAMLNLARANRGTPQMHDREWVLRHAALLDRTALPAVAPAGGLLGRVQSRGPPRHPGRSTQRLGVDDHQGRVL
ncbi:hypothetical protein [Kitasatospora sp. NPDC093679]|uniref:hypothetical protein n=1 Tax=Kitasatospora sp. NPDC093679 TaxID=3154983 RepID=UPI00342A730D